MSVRVKVYGKESTQKGFMVLDELLGAVKVVYTDKVVILTADGKVTQLEQQTIGE